MYSPSFSLAFAEWLHAEADRHLALWQTPSYGDGVVELALRRFAPRDQHFLSAPLARTRASVDVEWDYEPWGQLVAYDFDATPAEGGGWRPAIGASSDLVYLQLERLWRDALFEPLRGWIAARLLSADVLYLHERRGLRWATLGTREAPVPANVCLAVYGSAE